MKVKNILISQPEPTNSPYNEITSKFGVNIDFFPFFKVEPLSAKDFRAQRINILDYSAIVFTSKATIDAFFKLSEELRITVPETMKYFCASEGIANYLQKHIVYRKRKIFFGNGSLSSIPELIGTKHKGERFLLAIAENCTADLKNMFSRLGVEFASAIFVRPVNCDLRQIDLSKYQMMVFYSPSDIKSLFENYPDFSQGDMLIATYGQSTAKELANANLISSISAPQPGIPSIAKALEMFLSKK